MSARAMVATAALVLAATGCASASRTPGTVDKSRADAQAGWTLDYVTTTCRQYNGDMTEAQRLVAADAILNGDWYADPPSATGGGEGYPNPPDSLVSQFDGAVSQACASVPTKSLDNASNGVIASSGHWRLEAGQ